MHIKEKNTKCKHNFCTTFLKNPYKEVIIK